MQLLASAPEATTHRFAYVLRDACEAHPPIRLMVDNAIDWALATGGQTSVTPVMVLVMWEDGAGALAASARQRLHRLVRALDHQQRRTLAPLVGNLREKTHRCRTASIIRGRVTARHG